MYYHRLKKVLKRPRKKERRLIAIDETKIKLEKKLIFRWAYQTLIQKNAQPYGLLNTRNFLRFLERSPNTAKTSQKQLQNRGFQYKALQRLGLKYRHETFGERNAVEGFFSFKERTKRFWNRFPFRSSFDSVQSWLDSII